MSGTYTLFRGDSYFTDEEELEVDESAWEPLDREAVERFLAEIPDIETAGQNEYLWAWPSLAVSIFLTHAGEGDALRAVSATVRGSGPTFAGDLAALLHRLATLGERLGARLYLEEHEEYIGPDDVERHVAPLRR